VGVIILPHAGCPGAQPEASGSCITYLHFSQAFRDGNEFANIDLVDAPSTPAAESPVREHLVTTPFTGPSVSSIDSQRWSSPAFVKRSRLSSGSLFGSTFDTLPTDSEDGPDRKRRRKSYRDWNAWTYSARTPSPEKDGSDMEVDPDLAASPTRPTTLPDTPVSPPKLQEEPVPRLSPVQSPAGDEDQVVANVVESAAEAHGTSGENAVTALTTEDFVRDADYYELYAGPDEVPPPDMTYAYGGDTEQNTEEEVDDTQVSGESLVSGESSGPTKEDTDIVVISDDEDVEVGGVDLDKSYADATMDTDAERLENHEAPVILETVPPEIVMPPPLLPSLQTSFTANPFTVMLIPIGREPSSPVIKPLDSSTLPMPSPFPSDRDDVATSYLDIQTSTHQVGASPSQAAPTPEEESFVENDYIESSFFSTVSAAQNSASHSNQHESAFTDVRFTFGLDGTFMSHLASDTQGLTVEEEDEQVQDADLGSRDHPMPEASIQEELGNQQAPDMSEQYISHDSAAAMSLGDGQPVEEAAAVSSPVNMYHEAGIDIVPSSNLAGTPLLSAQEDLQDLRDDEDFVEDAFVLQKSTSEPPNVDRNLDIKMESIENELLFPGSELLTILSEDGHNTGKMQADNAADTGPARNTRSKTKMSMSPVTEGVSASPPQTRSGRLKTTARITLSPVNTRSRSTLSSIEEAVSASPYSLRSQSKNLSPTNISSSAPELDRPTRGRQGKRGTSLLSSPLRESFSQPGPSRFEPIELPDIGFGPSQELGEPYGKFSNTSYVKDSEEGSLHSEHSLSTVPYSDEFGDFGMQTYTNFSDPTVDYMDRDSWQATQTLVDDGPEQIDQEPLGDLAKAQQPSLPEEVVFDGVVKSQASRRDVYEISSDSSDVDDKDGFRDTTPKAQDNPTAVTYPRLQVELRESEIIDLGSSPPASVSSLPPPEPGPALVEHKPHINSSLPATPDATQQSFPLSLHTLVPARVAQSLPMTPQLTQTTSAELLKIAFEADVKMEEVSQEQLVKPSQVTSTTPRRNVTATDVASASASPSIHSEDLSDSETETQVATTTAPPSVGLSTPTSYYTPLRDLIYFLNRSSQFHTSANPDILALVTSPSTAPKRAEKGPKHWTTTFHITDVSLFPHHRTVQVFRPFQSALPIAQKGDVVLLRAFQVKSLNRTPMLLSGDESAWCVWRWGKPVWGKKRGAFGELRARGEVRGPSVEMGEGEWLEVERLRAWWMSRAETEVDEEEVADEEMDIDMRSSQVTGRDNGKAKVIGVYEVEEIGGDAEM
jgi:hypothetical protein